MASKEFKKVFLEVDTQYRLNGDLFGNEWNQLRKQQIEFLLERPLMFKVLTERVLGPQKLIVLSAHEFWEAEQELRKSNKKQEIEELADMALLSLTFDSLNPNLSKPSQKSLAQIEWQENVVDYCGEIGLDMKKLMITAAKKIKTNKDRNPKEAFMLVANEDMSTSINRMQNNWSELKKKRNQAGFNFKRQDWWKQWLYVDDRGWVKSIK